MALSYAVLLVLVIALLWINAEILAYDCSDKSTELTKVSLLAIKPCIDPRNSTDTQFKNIQLVQKRQYVAIQVYSCLVKVHQMIHYCGMHSHVSLVAGGFGKYVQSIGHDECIKAHKFRTLNLAGIGAGVISRLSLNGTTEVSTTLQGHIVVDGKCEGVRFSVGEVQYTNVVVSAAISISLHDYMTTADVERNIVHLRSGTVCPYNDGFCFDDDEGEASWQQHLASICTSKGVDVLFEGNATVLTLRETPPSRYVIVETDDTVFALKLTRPEELCHQRAWQTEQNRLLVVFEDSLGFYYMHSNRLPQNTDMMAHVLSKLLYLEIAVKRQMADVIYDSILKRCQLREKILHNRLAMAKQSPDAIGNLVKESTGYVSRVMGEVLYIAKCKAVIVEFRRTTQCFQELPISYLNRSVYRTPTTHIIVDHGTEVECNPLLPVSFLLDRTWIELHPEMRRSDDAIQLDANNEEDKITMRGISPISANGVYTREDLERFQHTLLYPSTKKAVTNQIARRIVGIGGNDPYHMPNLFTPTEFRTFAHSAAEEVWGFLSYMGNIFSICGFLYTLFCAISYLAGTITNYFTLDKATRGHPKRKKYLLASLWHHLAHRYLYQLYSQKTSQKNEDHGEEKEEEALELVNVQVDVPKLYPHIAKPPSAPCQDPTCPVRDLGNNPIDTK